MTHSNATLSEATAAIGLSRPTLYRMEAAGEIAFIRIRGRTLVPMSEIIRLTTPSESATQAPVGGPVGEPKKLRVKKRKLFPALME